MSAHIHQSVTPEAGAAEAVAVRPGREMFRALAHRNFRLFWAGAFLSNVGTWMQTVAQGWLMLKLTDSAFWLGLDGFAATVPGLVLTLLGGVFADLVDRKRLLLVTQALSGLTAIALALAILTDHVTAWGILVASFVTGCCFSIAAPSYQAIMIDLVGREDLSNAIALNSTQFQLSRVLGPVLAGVAFATLGLAGCFLANGLSYVAIVIALALVKMNVAKAGQKHSLRDRAALWRDLVAGFRYVSKRPRVSLLLLISAVTSLFGAPYLTMMPIFARDVFAMGEGGLSVMMGTAGAGSFCAALLLVYLGDPRRKGWFVLGGTLAFGVGLACFALSKNIYASLFFLFALGFAIVCAVAVTNMLLQRLVTDEMRGRVMSMFILSFIGVWPLGNILAGASATRVGAPYTLAAGGLVTALFGAFVAVRYPRLRTLD
ncbi:MAG: MFS transporter [Pyrinomonadaceae bacterium]